MLSERLGRVVRALSPAGPRPERRPRPRRVPGVEPLEGRALLANITASAVISSAPDGANFDYTITLTNSSSSTSPVGTFWYAWNTPSFDYLATSPVSVTPPAGWSDQITNAGSSDGHAILYTANSAASSLAPGASLTFKFTSADPPSSVNGNSPFYPGVPVNTSFVYPQGPFSDAGHQFVVTPATTTNPNPAPTTGSNPAPGPSTTPAPPVQISSVHVVQNRKHLVTGVVVDFTGDLNASTAQNAADFVLTTAAKKGVHKATKGNSLALSSAAYDSALHEVTLTPSKPFALTNPVQFVVNGTAPGGLQDSSGRFIDGNNDGIGGDNGQFMITRRGVSGA
jgi:hypothetical protein